MAIIGRIIGLLLFLVAIRYGFGGDYARGTYYLAFSIALDLSANRLAESSK